MLVIFLSLTYILSIRASSCRFALSTSCDQLLSNQTARMNFITSIFQNENHFHTPGISYNNATGFTYDGHPLDYTTGEATGSVHSFSAASKESLHVGLLALAVSGNSLALTFVGGIDTALDLLTKKITTYENWNAKYPGYGGYLPWVTVTDNGLEPTPDWCSPICRVPALDNGEWVWSLYATQSVLTTVGQTSLANRYRNYFNLLCKYGKIIFLEPPSTSGKVRAVAQILNTKITPVESNYLTDGNGYLNDPYEGELFTVLLDLYGPWNNSNDREQLWIVKRNMLQSVNFQSTSGPITVQKGYWFSSHEQWKLLMLPYFDIDLVRRIFRNCERARSWNSYMNQIPGLYASVNDVTQPPSIDIPDYVGATGIESIAFEEVERTDVVTPYGSWILLYLSNDKEPTFSGLCWYRNMLAGPRCQGPYGSTEAVNINGTEISPLVTWDSKITNVLALAGGLGAINANNLKQEKDLFTPGQTLYDRFTFVLNREYSLVFPTLLGETIDFAIPNASIPNALQPSDFTDCVS